MENTIITQSLRQAVAQPSQAEVFELVSELVENKVNVYETGIFDSSNFEFDGTGMTVAVLDTGLVYKYIACCKS